MQRIILNVYLLICFIVVFKFFLSGYFNLRKGLKITGGRVLNISEILRGNIEKNELKKAGKNFLLMYISLAMLLIGAIIIEKTIR